MEREKYPSTERLSNWKEWKASLGDNSLNVSHFCTYMVCTETPVTFVPGCFSKYNCTVSSLGRWSLFIQNRAQVCFLARIIKRAYFLEQTFACLPLLRWVCMQSGLQLSHKVTVFRDFAWIPIPLCEISDHRKRWKYESRAVFCSVY